MKIYILRNGINHGPYPPDTVKNYLLEGSLVPQDLSWAPGNDKEWKPLSESFPELVQVILPERLLTEEIVEKFLHDPSVELNQYKEIEELAAYKLLNYNGDLDLDGLEAISDPVAEYLSTHSGGSLHLCGLEELSDDAAESFSKHDGELYLDGVIKLGPQAQEFLASREEYLSMDSFMDIADSSSESVEVRECERVTTWFARTAVSLEVSYFRQLVEDPYEGEDEEDFLRWLTDRFSHCHGDWGNIDTRPTLLQKINDEDISWYIEEALDQLFGDSKNELEEYSCSAEKFCDNWFEIGEINSSYRKQGGFNARYDTMS